MIHVMSGSQRAEGTYGVEVGGGGGGWGGGWGGGGCN